MKNNKIFFSVVIPLYNKANHIKRAIDSVLKQKLQNFEIIVVNDGSTDKGEDIVAQYTDKRIKLINQQNQGVSVARNKGILESKGDYITFLDADDEWLEDFLETIQKLIIKYPQAGAFATSYFISENTILSKKRYKSLGNKWEGVLDSYFKVTYKNGSPLCTITVCIKKKIFKKSGLFREGMKMAQDIDLWVRVALNTEIAFTTECKAIYYTESDNRTPQRVGAPKTEPYFIQYLEKYLRENIVDDKLKKDIKKFNAFFLLVFAYKNILARDFKQANRFLFDKRSFSHKKLQFKYMIVYFLKKYNLK